MNLLISKISTIQNHYSLRIFTCGIISIYVLISSGIDQPTTVSLPIAAPFSCNYLNLLFIHLFTQSVMFPLLTKRKLFQHFIQKTLL